MLIRKITPNPLKGAFLGSEPKNFHSAKSPLGDLGVTTTIGNKILASGIQPLAIFF